MSKKLIIIISIIAVVAIAAVVLGVVLSKDKPAQTDKGALVEENKETSAGNVEGTLEEIMTKVYAGIPEENLPMALSNMEVNAENVEGFLGTANIEYAEALANESMVGSIAHSVVLVRLNDAKDAEDTVQTIKDNVDPRKWICVEVPEEDVIVKSKGDLIILIMVADENTRNKIEEGFDNL